MNVPIPYQNSHWATAVIIVMLIVLTWGMWKYFKKQTAFITKRHLAISQAPFFLYFVTVFAVALLVLFALSFAVTLKTVFFLFCFFNFYGVLPFAVSADRANAFFVYCYRYGSICFCFTCYSRAFCCDSILRLVQQGSFIAHFYSRSFTCVVDDCVCFAAYADSCTCFLLFNYYADTDLLHWLLLCRFLCCSLSLQQMHLLLLFAYNSRIRVADWIYFT